MPVPAHPDLDLLASARVHEATGSGRRTFALALAGRLQGAVLWVQDRRTPEMLYPPGIAAFLDPARLILVQPTGALPILQVMEEALRSGAAPLVIGELGEAPDLTASRRLQLAAGTGGGRGLCLVPETRLRTNAAETRWRCAPMPGGGTARQHWEILKNKKGRLGQWHVCWDPTAERFAEVVKEAEMA
ncbi:MAG: ImuA family protein [Paracoccaceae bacterium]